MKRSLMVAACLAALAAPALAPTVALAQDGSGARHRPRDLPQRHERVRAPDEAPAREPAPSRERPSRPERPQGSQDHERPNRPSRPDRPRGDNGQRHDRPQGGQRPDRPQTGSRPDRPRDGQRPDRPRGDRDGGWNGQNRPGGDHRPGRDRNDHNGRRDHNGGWNRGDRNDHGGRRDHDRDRRDFRNRFNGDQWRRDWNRRHGNDWWRHDRRWNGWSGVRIGFYFSPGYGYYSVPRSYFGQRWYAGDYLPSIFWRYRLDDWRTFGLGVPPPGTEWVWVNNDLYLIDSFDGYIVDAIYNVWSW